MGKPKQIVISLNLGTDDQDLKDFKASCQETFGVRATEFAKAAIREKIVNERSKSEDMVSLKQILRLLTKQSERLDQILSYFDEELHVRHAEKKHAIHDERAEHVESSDFVESCQDLGWGGS